MIFYLYIIITHSNVVIISDNKIRQAITNVKGASIADRPKDIDKREEIGHWINNYPRKILGRLSANLAEKKYMAA